MLISLAVVAHPARAEQAQQLATQLDCPIAMDTPRRGGTYGGQNHDRALILANREQDEDTDWVCILEDDAQPVPDFREQLHEALSVCPTSAASLYLGNQRDQPRARKLQPLLDHDPHWIVTDSLWHAVCFAIRTPLLHQLLTTVENVTRLDADRRYGWGLTRMGGYRIAHATSSLVEHRDETPVIGRRSDGQPRVEPRRALKVRGREVWDSTYQTL